jgi:hypothetical protein
VLHYISPVIIGFDAPVVSRGRRHRQSRPVTFVPAACRRDAAKTSVASTDPPRIRHPTATQTRRRPGRAAIPAGVDVQVVAYSERPTLWEGISELSAEV